MNFKDLKDKVLSWAKDKHSWTSLGLCLLGAGFLYAVTEIINDEKMEGER